MGLRCLMEWCWFREDVTDIKKKLESPIKPVYKNSCAHDFLPGFIITMVG